MSSPLGLAIVGSSGHAARVCAPAVAAAPDARLVGVLGSEPARSRGLAERHAGARAYADWSELLDDREVDAVWIAGPNHLHAPFAARCLTAGRHVLVEKPLATTRASAQELVDLATVHGRTLKVAFQHRFRPGHRWLRAEVLGGALGSIALLRIHRCWRYPYFPEMSPDPRGTWRGTIAGSGGWVLNDIGSHLVDLAGWLLGARLRLVSSVTRRLRFHEAEGEDTAVLVLDSDAGSLITIETSNAVDGAPGTVELQGAAGWLRASGTFDREATILDHLGRVRRFDVDSPLRLHIDVVTDFCAEVAGSPSVGAAVEEAADTVAIIERAVSGSALDPASASASGHPIVGPT